MSLPCLCRFTICHKTEVVKNTLNPVWQAFTIPVRALCNGDYDRYRLHTGYILVITQLEPSVTETTTGTGYTLVTYWS